MQMLTPYIGHYNVLSAFFPAVLSILYFVCLTMKNHF